MDVQTDEALLKRTALGDGTALAELYDRHGGLAYSLAYRVTGDAGAAQDVVQEAFVNIWRRASSFDPTRGNGKSWLLSVVHHRAIDIARRQRGDVPLDLFPDPPQRGVAAPDAWQHVSSNIDKQALLEAMSKIPVEQREAIELNFFGGYTHEEIASRFDLPLGTVKGRIRLGIGKLRDLIRDKDGGA